MRFLVPRLTTGSAIQLFREASDCLAAGTQPADLVRMDVVGTPNPTGGSAPDMVRLEAWRREILERLDGISPTSKPGRDKHSLVLGQAIAEIINPIPADVAHDGTWSYLSLAILPDVVNARWPGESQGGKVVLPPERWIGAQAGNRDRNYLKSAWRRWVELGPVMSAAKPALGEDEFGALMERTAVARNRRLIRAAALKTLDMGPTQPGGRAEFARRLMKQICARTGSLTLDVLSDSELESFVDQQARLCAELGSPRRAA